MPTRMIAPLRRTSRTDELREALQYLAAFHGQLFVIKIPGACFQHERFDVLIRDICLLCSCGIHVILVHGAGTTLQQHGVGSVRGEHLVLPDGLPETLAEDIQWLTLRTQQELTAREPELHVLAVTGTFVRARRAEGRGAAGEPGDILPELGRQARLPRTVPILNPLCLDECGNLVYVPADILAARVAGATAARKLIFLVGRHGVMVEKQLVSHLNLDEAEKHLVDRTIKGPLANTVRLGIAACRQDGHCRVHLVNWTADGSLLEEFLTGHGVGTMIHADLATYHRTRPANLGDVGAIARLIQQPLYAGSSVAWAPQEIRKNLSEFVVYERDGRVYGCVCIDPLPHDSTAELHCLALHPEYVEKEILLHLLRTATMLGHQRGYRRIFAETPLFDWFEEAGHRLARPEEVEQIRGKQSAAGDIVLFVHEQP